MTSAGIVVDLHLEFEVTVDRRLVAQTNHKRGFRQGNKGRGNHGDLVRGVEVGHLPGRDAKRAEQRLDDARIHPALGKLHGLETRVHVAVQKKAAST